MKLICHFSEGEQDEVKEANYYGMQLAAELHRDFGLAPHLAAEMAIHLQRIAAVAHRNAEDLCNIPDTEDLRKQIREDLLEIWNKRANGEHMPEDIKAKMQAARFEVSGDPRGCVLRLFRNSEDRDGLAVVHNRDYDPAN